jgi:hypothetical protein
MPSEQESDNSSQKKHRMFDKELARRLNEREKYLERAKGLPTLSKV